MKKRYLLLAVLLMSLVFGYGQIKWPKITSVTKPWTRWWWMGSAVNKKDLTACMEQYRAAGLGGLEITPIYGVKGDENRFVEYLSPQWMQLLEYTLQEARRLNLTIDMATGTGWPFGGGPLIGDKEACKDFVYKTWNLAEGQSLQEPVRFIQEPLLRSVNNQVHDIHSIKDPVYLNRNLQALALDQVKFQKPLPLQALMAYGDNGQVIDLTGKVDAKGNLAWTAPKGNWTLYALFMGWHGKMVERAAPGGEGNAIDHFSLQAVNTYFSRFDKAFAGRPLTGLRGFFNDSYEVDDARGQSNWTPGFFDEFARRRGYDLRQHLPALLQKDPDESSLRILYDYRQTISDLLLEKFTTPWHNWAKAKGKIVRNQSHGSPANIMDLYGAVDIPETEGTDLLRFKFATSASHVSGKPLASAEAATWLNEHFKSTLADVKEAVDNYFLGGVNHIVYHGTSYSPQEDPWPGWLFYAAVHFQPTNPAWKDFGALNQYVTRCQSFLQSGKPDNDVLLYFPFPDKNSSPGRDLLHHFDGMNGFENTDFKAVAEEMLAKGYAFDLISDKQLQQVTVTGRTLQTGGTGYQTIVLANVKYLPLESWQKILQLVKAGATVIVFKNLPSGVPGYSSLKIRQAAFEKLSGQLKFTGNRGNTIQKARLGNGMLLQGDNTIEQLLSACNVRREELTDGLQCIRRKVNNDIYYFIVNQGRQKVDAWVSLKTYKQGVALFNPMTQQAGVAKFIPQDDYTTLVYLQLLPGESVIVQASGKPIKGEPYHYYTYGKPVTIPGNWSLKFLRGGPVLPEGQQAISPGSWTELPGEELKKFSGTAQYGIYFSKPATVADAFVLDLGKVEQSAEVWLNGQKIATLTGPVFSVTIPANQLLAENLLQVHVSNGMANRIIDLEKRGINWKKFYNVNFPARLATNRDEEGLFTAKNWQPEPSGLLGPVTLTPAFLIK